MSLRSTLSVLALACTSFVVGCSANADDGGSSSKSSEVTLAGNVDGAGSGGGTTTRSFGGLAASSAGLHVVAHEVHLRGVTGRTVDVAVAADGSFHVGVERGKRWLVTVDDADNSAIVTFANGDNVLRVSADGDAGRVDVGDLEVVGGEATASFALDARLGIDLAIAAEGDVFEAANGAVIAAREAADEARKAADEARKAADDARARRTQHAPRPTPREKLRGSEAQGRHGSSRITASGATAVTAPAMPSTRNAARNAKVSQYV